MGFPIRHGDFLVRYVKLPEGIGSDDNLHDAYDFITFTTHIITHIRG